MKKYDSFENFMKDVKFHREFITLPDGRTTSKLPYITKNGIHFESFREMLLNVYEKEFKE